MSSSVQGFTALERRLKAIGDTSAFMKSIQTSAIEEAQHNVAPHRKTGHLQASIVRGPVTETTAVVKVGANYGASMEFGAKPHIIRPKSARVLAWGGGRRLSGRLRSGAKPDHFAAFVHHPGNKPYPFLVPGARTALKKHGVDAVVKAWNDAA